MDWNRFIGALEESHVRITDWEDEIIWVATPHSRYTPQNGYTFLISEQEPMEVVLWWQPLWKLKAPHKA